MLTKGDDYPLHQTPEPMAVSGADRNFYDRYFFNGYSADGSIFFAAAMGIYPQLDIIDASFCLLIDGVQHNIRASRRMGSERLDMTVGPIRVEIVEALAQLRLTIADNDSPITADILFTARHAPIEEPRFTRRNGPRMFMDYTRMTQNGGWSGTITHDGTDHALSSDTHFGTRDRSWGIRPIGAPESQPPPSGTLPQFYWLWAPLNFSDRVSFFHTNDDGDGEGWNRRGVIDTIGGDAIEYDRIDYTVSYTSGTRRVARLDAMLAPDGSASLTIEPVGPDFHMSGLGYMHPVWGHGLDHGGLETAYDTIEAAAAAPHEQLHWHIQAFSRATLTINGTAHQGHGVLEQAIVGPHAPSGFSELLDMAD
ncbi:hypothetical protein HFP51_09560 [Parasphingopyxis sp. CP4]|uniref:hypothetical protein n=1 Tax=Parasphingopyxis sp. CP4 TaxID=2724527 RepID=UPI0015A26FA4|nr:hypothetical protein [Parasphingopyxis sp. CP4]QLC22402.1 hypothetical protein HFP51_09560 [Parasphingopyxis sp. CP4]